MLPSNTNLLQGTLDVLILKVLALQPMHGLGISNRIAQVTSNTFLVKPGSLFPTLHRMEEAGWLTSSWGESENNRRAKFYRFTAAGRRQLKQETDLWARIAAAMARALEAMALLNILLQIKHNWPWQSGWKLAGPTGQKK